MSRRMIDSRMWSDESFKAMPAMARLLQIGMINHADDQGRIKAGPAYLYGLLFLEDDVTTEQIQGWLKQMEANDTIRLYTVSGKQYAQFINWWEYQSLQFARPSQYPRPLGWDDRIRFNDKGNLMLVCNWTTPSGGRMVDTCDQDGKALPFKMELPAKKSGAEPPAQAATNPPATVDAEVRTSAPTVVPAEVRTQVRGEVTKLNLTKDQDQQKKNNNDNNSALHALVMAEAEKAVVVVGVDHLLNEFDEEQAKALLSWLWLYNGWFEEDLDYRDLFRREYRHDPFASMKEPSAVIVKLARARTPAPLKTNDRAEMRAKLRELQEVAA